MYLLYLIEQEASSGLHGLFVRRYAILPGTKSMAQPAQAALFVIGELLELGRDVSAVAPIPAVYPSRVASASGTYIPDTGQADGLQEGSGPPL